MATGTGRILLAALLLMVVSAGAAAWLLTVESDADLYGPRDNASGSTADRQANESGDQAAERERRANLSSSPVAPPPSPLTNALADSSPPSATPTEPPTPPALVTTLRFECSPVVLEPVNVALIDGKDWYRMTWLGQRVERLRDYKTKVDGEGVHTLAGLQPGDCFASIHAEGYARKQVDLPPRQEGSVLDLGEVVLSRGVTVMGMVVDEEGNGVPDTEVLYEEGSHPGAADLADWYSIPAATKTGERGGFGVAGLMHGGHYTFMARKDGCACQPVHFTADELGSANVTIRLMRGGYIEGVLVVPEGTPPPDQPGQGTFDNGNLVTPSMYELPQLLFVHVYLTDGTPPTLLPGMIAERMPARPATIPAAMVKADWTFAVNEASASRHRGFGFSEVVDSAGVPVDPPVSPGKRPVLPGKYELWAELNHEVRVAQVEVKAGLIVRAELVFGATSGVEISFVNEHGTRILSADVFLIPGGTTLDPKLPLSRYAAAFANTGSRAGVEFRDVKPGPWAVRVAGYDDVFPLTTGAGEFGSFTLLPGRTANFTLTLKKQASRARVNLRFLLNGKAPELSNVQVLGRVEGDPGLRGTALESKDGLPFHAQSLGEGTYVLNGLPVGFYSVRALADCGADGTFPMNHLFSVKPGQSELDETCSIDLGSVSGRVMVPLMGLPHPSSVVVSLSNPAASEAMGIPPWISVTCAADGSFRFPLVRLSDPDPVKGPAYRIEVAAPGRVTEPYPAPPATEGFLVRGDEYFTIPLGRESGSIRLRIAGFEGPELPRIRWMTGRQALSNANDQPPPVISFRRSRMAISWQFQHDSMKHVQMNAQGDEVTLTAIEPGRWTLSLTVPGFAVWSREVVVAVRTTSTVDVILQRFGTFELTLPGQTLTAEEADGLVVELRRNRLERNEPDFTYRNCFTRRDDGVYGWQCPWATESGVHVTVKGPGFAPWTRHYVGAEPGPTRNVEVFLTRETAKPE